MTLGADFIATGHYARRAETAYNSKGEAYAPLLRGLDKIKTKLISYMQCMAVKLINPFPVGEIENRKFVELLKNWT